MQRPPLTRSLPDARPMRPARGEIFARGECPIYDRAPRQVLPPTADCVELLSTMCGRFTQGYTWQEIRDIYDLIGTAQNLEPRFNIAPTQQIDVVYVQGGALAAKMGPGADSDAFLLRGARHGGRIRVVISGSDCNRVSGIGDIGNDLDACSFQLDKNLVLPIVAISCGRVVRGHELRCLTCGHPNADISLQQL